MKKIFLILALGAMVASCTPDQNGGDEGDVKNRVTLTFEGDYWNSLIDNAQYNGDLLYKQEGYSWYDEATDLSHSVNGGKYGSYYYMGGMAVSNFYSTDYSTAQTFMEQLTVYAEGAHSGSNCILSNGYHSSWSAMGYGDCPVLEFKSAAAYIESVWVANTCYSYSSAIGGLNDQTPALTSEQSVWVRATGYTLDAEGNEVEGSSLDFYLYKEGKALFEGWSKWDLSALGKVNKIKFDVQWNGEGGADNFLHPAYFALDDITVVKE